MIKDGPRTRKKLLKEAETLFAAKGFHGTSLSMVAARVGISKPSLLHHFASKEKLYGAVLEGIAEDLLKDLRRDLEGVDDEFEQLQRFAEDLCRWSEKRRVHTQILMRELLDNPARPRKIRTWYLAPLIHSLVAVVEAGQRKGKFRDVNSLAFVYTLLGTQHYYAVSEPTLARMLGKEACARLAAGRGDELKRLLDGLLPTIQLPPSRR